MEKQYLIPPYRHCPSCAGRLSQKNPYRQKCLSCASILYHSSSPCVGALPLDDSGRVLLAKRSIEPFYGAWNTIGGFLEYQEDPIEGLKREVKEETGVDCTVKEFITMNADTYGPGGTALLNSYFTVRLLSTEIHPQDDVSELKWFHMSNLPKNIAFASDRKALAALRANLTPS